MGRVRARSKVFGYGDNIHAIPAVISAGVQHFADEMNAKTSDFTLGRRQIGIRLGPVKGIEFMAIIADLDREHIVLQSNRHLDEVLLFIVVTVFDDIGDQFLNGEVGREDRFRLGAVFFQKGGYLVGQAGQFAKIIPKGEGNNRHKGNTY